MFKLMKHPHDDRALWACPFCDDIRPVDCGECTIGCNESFWDGHYEASCSYNCRYCEGSGLLSIDQLHQLIKECHSNVCGNCSTITRHLNDCGVCPTCHVELIAEAEAQRKEDIEEYNSERMASWASACADEELKRTQS